MNKKKSPRLVAGLGLVILFFFVILQSGLHPAPVLAATTLPESNDFATRVLRDPWDMSEFTDISTYLNNSAQADFLQNYQISSNGIFSAQSTSTADAQFSLLFPGYRISTNVNAINAGKYGVNYPISSSTYRCLSIAMQVNTSASDAFVIYWFADSHLNEGPSPWGYSSFQAIQPSVWKLYSLNLTTNYGGGTAWSGNTTWQGLRLDPTTKANVAFAIDWARLTDCAAVNTTLTWPADSRGNALWLISATTTNPILVQTGVNGSLGSATFDTQGLAAGSYTVGLGTSTTCCYQTGNVITINQAPIATFNRPSPYSGVDYATQAGNPWDFVDATDVGQNMNLSWSLSGGLMNMTTASGTSLANVADPIIYLNTPQPIASGSQYRYLTFRMNTELPLQNVPFGMIVRWVWEVNGLCTMWSYDIPYDVGWQMYSIDLSNAFNGSAELAQYCSPGNWNTSTNITRVRIDPNENILGRPLVQQLDWIRLTQLDRVTRGTPFPIQLSMNKPPQGATFNFYYTTSLSQPTQHVAAQASAVTPVPVTPNPAFVRAYLPFTTGGSAGNSNTDMPPVVNGVAFSWDTSSVATGIYYICVTANDTVSQGTYCSDAPVQVQ